MRLRKLGHACLLVSSGDARILIDPGTFSSGFEDLDGLTAVLNEIWTANSNATAMLAARLIEMGERR